MIVWHYPTREAWALARLASDTLGASEVAAALGVHAHMSAWDLWRKKREGVCVEQTSAMGRGHRWESAVLAEYEEASGNRVVSPGDYFGHPGELITVANDAFPWLRSSPDAFAWQGDTLGHVEAKTAVHAHAWSPEVGVVIDRWSDECADLLPPMYAVQAYSQLAATGMPWNDVCALVPHGGWLAVRFVRVMADPDTQSAIVAAASAWRDRYLVGGETPGIDGSEACNRFFAVRNGPARETRHAAEDEALLIRRLATLRAQSKEIESEVKTLTNTLVDRSDGARLLLPVGFGQSERNQGKEGIDADRLKTEFPEAHAACAKRGQPFVVFKTYKVE